MRFPGWILRTATVMAFFCGLLNAGEPATAVATVTAGFVTGITVTSGGSSYVSEPAVTLTGGGGSGATAKAVLSGDKVALVVVLTAGSGYTNSPTVLPGSPPTPHGVKLRLVPELTIQGPVGSWSRVESAAFVTGPWTMWTNVMIGAEGAVLVDLSPGSSTRFYRSVAGVVPGPVGFVWIPPGTFMMGTPTTEEGYHFTENQHRVVLTQGFWLSDHEVTQGEYQALMGSNPSIFTGDVDRPVETVSWDDAIQYCQKLTERERANGRIAMQHAYRLPTEAEWEYAARAGTTGARYGELDAIAWYAVNSGGRTRAVKQKIPNAWGLYDMIGNVSEWCGDFLAEYPDVGVTDPAGMPSDYRIRRGGSWNHSNRFDLRSARRESTGVVSKDKIVGFRPALSSVR
jgi:formylglycine-generating enzyme required for sulfatase activity